LEVRSLWVKGLKCRLTEDQCAWVVRVLPRAQGRVVWSEVDSWKPVCVASEQGPVTHTDCSKAVTSHCRALSVVMQSAVGSLCVGVGSYHRRWSLWKLEACERSLIWFDGCDFRDTLTIRESLVWQSVWVASEYGRSRSSKRLMRWL